MVRSEWLRAFMSCSWHIQECSSTRVGIFVLFSDVSQMFRIFLEHGRYSISNYQMLNKVRWRPKSTLWIKQCRGYQRIWRWLFGWSVRELKWSGWGQCGVWGNGKNVINVDNSLRKVGCDGRKRNMGLIEGLAFA